ncbi:MAG: ABC transporter ATP-binding protein [Myxococcales bacterium]|nr:ABC transporter ATP-binding protein [Myxococcales bacterium]
MPMLELEGIHAGYGAVKVLRDFNIRIDDGEIVTLIGANGAGKSTALLTISGVVKPTAGVVRYQGEDIAGVRTHELVGRGLAHSPEGRRIFARLTVHENLELGAYTRRDTQAVAKEIATTYELFPVLGQRREQPGGTLSGGEQQMLALGRALMSKPKLLLLDEPSLGLAPLIVRAIFDVLVKLRESGVTVLLVEQNARMALELADRGYVIETGEIRLSGPGKELLADERVRGAYLGESHDAA